MSSPDEPSVPDMARPNLPRAWQPAWRLRPAVLAGRGNRIEGSGLGGALLRLTTLFYGASCDNLVRVGRNFSWRGLSISVEGAGNRIEIGDDVRLAGSISLRGFGLTVRIGDRCDIKRSRIVAGDAGIAIGSDCLVAAGVIIRSSDMHVIADRAGGEPINSPAEVVVGDGVWLAAEAALMKGSRIPPGCVVGFRSVVTEAFDEPDCVITGSPARVVRRGITWSR